MFNTRKILAAAGGRIEVARAEPLPFMPAPAAGPQSLGAAPLRAPGPSRPLLQRPGMHAQPGRTLPFSSNSLPFPAVDEHDTVIVQSGPVRPYGYSERDSANF